MYGRNYGRIWGKSWNSDHGMRNFENFSAGFMYIREDGMREVCKEYGNVLIAMTGTLLFLAVAETLILGKNGVIALLIRTYMGG